jgi:hypothetical protein
MASYMKKGIGKLRSKPAPTKQDEDEGMDPAFEIPDDKAHEDGGDAGGEEPTIEDGSVDDDRDEETEARAKRGDMSPEKRGAGHEDGAHDELEKCSDQDLLKELKKRGHPAGEMHDEAAHAEEKGADATKGEHAEDDSGAEEYSA